MQPFAPAAQVGRRRPGPQQRRARRGGADQGAAPCRGTGTGMSGLNVLSRWLLFGEWRAHPLRAIIAIAAIAVGVAMGFAIHLINAAAFNEFSAAVKTIAGQADIQVAG